MHRPGEGRRALVSVVIPSYNHASFVAEAIASVAKQQEAEVELCVVDDCSSDGSPAVIERALRGFPGHCELLVQKNCGAHAAINRGLARVRGDYLHILNSDDRLPERRLATLLQAMESSRARFAFSDVRIVDSAGAELPVLHPKVRWYRNARRIMLSEPSIGFGLLRVNATVTTSNFLFRRELLEKVGEFTPEKLCHDWTFLMRVLPLAEPLHVPETLLDYRVHETNTVDRVRALRRSEGEPALREYFRIVSIAAPENKRAPCLVWWPGYFPVFVETRNPWFAEEPMTNFLPEKTVEAIKGTDKPTAEPASLAARDRSIRALTRELGLRDSVIRELRRKLAALRQAQSPTSPVEFWAARRKVASLAAPFARGKPAAIIFGAGNGGSRAYRFLRPSWKITAFIDNDPAKQNARSCGRPVRSPASLALSGDEVIFIASVFGREIHEQLLTAGFPRHRIQQIDSSILDETESAERWGFKVILFGTGPGAEWASRHLSTECHVVTVPESVAASPTDELIGLLDVPLDELTGREFDWIVVASPRADEIAAQLEALGLPSGSIVVAHPDVHAAKVRPGERGGRGRIESP